MLVLSSGNYLITSLIKQFLINNSGIINLIIALIVSAVILLSLLSKKQFIFEKVPTFNVVTETLKKIIPNFVYAVIITLVFAMLIGYKPLIVTSGSMRPSIEPGAVILIKSVSFEDLKVGDVVTFTRNGKIYTTHQIIAINKDETGKELGFVEGQVVKCSLFGYTFDYTVTQADAGKSILTHGTANPFVVEDGVVIESTIDSPILAKNIKGKVYYCVWYIGLIVVTLKNQIIMLVITLLTIYFAYKNYISIPAYNAD